MLCKLTRRMISRAEDRGLALPGFAARHAGRCASCREFARFAASLGDRLAAELPGVLARAPEERPGTSFAAEVAGPGRGDAGATARGPRARRPLLRPLPAAAAVLIVAAGALVLFRVVPRTPSPSPAAGEAARAAIRSISAAPADLPALIGSAESSLAGERAVLERSVRSALDYLSVRLNIRIERRDDPKTL